MSWKQLNVLPQNVQARAMEGARIYLLRRALSQILSDALLYLARRPIGVSNGKYFIRPHVALQNELRHPRRQHARLPCTRPSHYPHRWSP